MHAFAIVGSYGLTFLGLVFPDVIFVYVFAPFCFPYDVPAIIGDGVGRFSGADFSRAVFEADACAKIVMLFVDERFRASSVATRASFGVNGGKIKGIEEGDDAKDYAAVDIEIRRDAELPQIEVRHRKPCA